MQHGCFSHAIEILNYFLLKAGQYQFHRNQRHRHINPKIYSCNRDPGRLEVEFSVQQHARRLDLCNDMSHREGIDVWMCQSCE